MFLSAADLYALQQAQSLAVESLLERLRPSLAVLGDPRSPTGTAALLDAQQGLFVAHRDAIQGNTVQARVGSGLFNLRVLARDSRTDLVLLTQSPDAARLAAPGVALAESEPPVGSRIYVLLAEGGLVGSFSGGQKLILKGEPKQAVPINELRFETQPQLVAGALVFSFDGKLMGTMGATIARQGNAVKANLDAIQSVQGSQELIRPKGIVPFNPGRSLLGPAPLTVAFTPSVSVVRRAVNGFLREGHRAEYAALGIQVADAPGGGAAVVWVMPDSPASRSGVKVNDVLLGIGDRSIQKQYDFVQALFAFRPGDKTTLRLRHDGVNRQVEVVLARSKA